MTLENDLSQNWRKGYSYQRNNKRSDIDNTGQLLPKVKIPYSSTLVHGHTLFFKLKVEPH